MIYGIGYDMLELPRITYLLQGRHKARFLQKILTAAEAEVCKLRKARMAEWIAGRFVAKEAVAKAFGTGIGATLGFQDIEVLPEPCGKPYVRICEAAWHRLHLPRDLYYIHISLSHQPRLVSAQVIIEFRPQHM